RGFPRSGNSFVDLLGTRLGIVADNVIKIGGIHVDQRRRGTNPFAVDVVWAHVIDLYIHISERVLEHAQIVLGGRRAGIGPMAMVLRRRLGYAWKRIARNTHRMEAGR